MNFPIIVIILLTSSEAFGKISLKSKINRSSEKTTYQHLYSIENQLFLESSSYAKNQGLDCSSVGGILYTNDFTSTDLNNFEKILLKNITKEKSDFQVSVQSKIYGTKNGFLKKHQKSSKLWEKKVSEVKKKLSPYSLVKLNVLKKNESTISVNFEYKGVFPLGIFIPINPNLTFSLENNKLSHTDKNKIGPITLSKDSPFHSLEFKTSKKITPFSKLTYTNNSTRDFKVTHGLIRPLRPKLDICSLLYEVK